MDFMLIYAIFYSKMNKIKYKYGLVVWSYLINQQKTGSCCQKYFKITSLLDNNSVSLDWIRFHIFKYLKLWNFYFADISKNSDVQIPNHQIHHHQQIQKES